MDGRVATRRIRQTKVRVWDRSRTKRGRDGDEKGRRETEEEDEEEKQVELVTGSENGWRMSRRSRGGRGEGRGKERRG